MRTIFMTLAILVIGFGQISAQKIKGKAEEAIKLDEIPGVITIISKDEKFKMIQAGTLNYLAPKDFYAPNWLGGMKGKIERSANKETDYTFEFVTDGLTIIDQSPLKSYDKASINGDIVEIKYTMSRRIVTKDKAGNVLQTWIVDDANKEKTAVIHPGFTAPVEAMQGTAVNPVQAGYVITEKYTMEKFEEDFEKNRNSIYARIESNEMNDLTSNHYLHYLEYAYSRIKTGKPKVMMIEKKHQADFSGLNEKINALVALLEKTYTDGFDQSTKDQSLELANFFASQYTNDSDKELKKICGFNASLCYGIANEPIKSNEQNKNISGLFGLFGGPTSQLEDNVEKFLYINQLYEAKQKGTVLLDPVMTTARLASIEADKKYEEAKAKMADKLKYNLRKVEGFIIDKDGNKQEGIIQELIVFEDNSSNIVNLDHGKVCYFTYSDGKGKFLKTGDVKSITAGDFYYEPIKEKESAGMKLLGAALTGRLSGTVFLPMIYGKGAYKVFYSVDYDSYLVKKDGDEFAYSIYSLTSNNKDAEAFIGDCTTLKEKIASKEIQNGREAAIQFVNIIADCNN